MLIYVSYFFGGLFFANALPHFVRGICGQPFQTPFAKPPGIGLSSSLTNTLWAAFNLAVAYVLLVMVGEFDIRNGGHALAFAFGALAISVSLSLHFGKLHGGRT